MNRIKTRNWIAVEAWKKHSGPMKNKKKETNKKLCRKKIRKEQ